MGKKDKKDEIQPKKKKDCKAWLKGVCEKHVVGKEYCPVGNHIPEKWGSKLPDNQEAEKKVKKLTEPIKLTKKQVKEKWEKVEGSSSNKNASSVKAPAKSAVKGGKLRKKGTE